MYNFTMINLRNHSFLIYYCNTFLQNILVVNKNLLGCRCHNLINSNFQYQTIRKNTYYKHKYSSEVEAAVNLQIRAEQQAAQDYLNIAVSFLHPCQSRPGSGGFFMRMFEEEMGHMQDFVQYQLLRGGMPIIQGLDSPESNMKITLLEAFQKALLMEKSVTKLLEELVKIAESQKDYQCADFVTSVFLAEQMRSVNEMAHHITKLSRLCDEHAIYHYDLQLAKTHPYSYKSKTPG